MFKKTPIRGTDRVSVTFETRKHSGASTIGVAGEFNEWDPEKTPMRRRKDGAWAATVRLDQGRGYQYRLVVDEGTWITDEEADAQVPNPYGGLNSVVQVPGDDG